MTEIDLNDLTRSSDEKKTVSMVLNYATDIASHNLTYLWAGVGAGKNYFVENMIGGRHGYPQLTVLLITSRKSKVTETLRKFDGTTSQKMTNGGNVIDLYAKHGYIPDEFCKFIRTDDGEIYEIIQQSTVCTNAYIEGYLRYVYDPLNPETHIWNRFDLIVWDEAHALVTDSTYQSAPFHVANLIHETFLRMETAEVTEVDETIDTPPSPRCKGIILMTGTPDALDGVLSLPCTNILDLRRTCENVMPGNVYFIDSVQAEMMISQQLADNERIIYFSNHVVQPDAVLKKYGLSPEKLAVSFSDDKRRKNLKDEKTNKIDGRSDFDRMEYTENYLAKHERLPDEIQMLFTTSRNKEGINIEDKDIEHVYIESHSITDIIQMAGRVRNGAKNIYIITEASGFSDIEHYQERTIAKQLTNEKFGRMSQINADLADYCRSLGVEDFVGNSEASLGEDEETNKKIYDYIDHFKSKSAYIQFDYIHNKFCYNTYRDMGRKLCLRERKDFDDLLKSPESLVDMFRVIFPDAEVHMPVSSYDQAMEFALDLMERFNRGKVSNEEFRNEIDTFDAMSDYSRNKTRRKSEHAQPNRVLGRFGLRAKQNNHKKKASDYTEAKIISCSSEKTA